MGPKSGRCETIGTAACGALGSLVGSPVFTRRSWLSQHFSYPPVPELRFPPRCATVAPCLPHGPAGTRPRTGWQRAWRSAGARGLSILDLTESNPTRCVFAYDPDPILQQLAAKAALRYEPDPRGLAVARDAVAGYYADRGTPVSPARIVLTTGTSEAYSFLFRLLADTGDEILAPSPSYPLLDFLAELNDVNLVTYPLLYENGWRVDLEELAAVISPRSRAIVVVTPNNPTGSFLQRGELERLIEFARDHDLALIADEVFRDYAWAPESSPPDSPGHRGGLPYLYLEWVIQDRGSTPDETGLDRDQRTEPAG